MVVSFYVVVMVITWPSAFLLALVLWFAESRRLAKMERTNRHAADLVRLVMIAQDRLRREAGVEVEPMSDEKEKLEWLLATLHMEDEQWRR